MACTHRRLGGSARVGIAAAIAAKGNRACNLGLRTRTPRDDADHRSGGPSSLLHRRRPGGGAGPVPEAGAVFRRLDAHTLLEVIDARGISQPFVYTLRREGGERRRLACVTPSDDTRQQLAMEPRSRRYIWIPGPITTVHDEHPYRELTVAAKIRLTSKRWISDRSRSAAVVLGNHP